MSTTATTNDPNANAPIDPAQAAKLYTGVHSFMVNACKFVVDTKYAPLKPLGRGAYGVVCSAIDKVTNKKVAIKKIPKAFEDLVDAKRILREVKLLRHFHHDNVIGLRDLVGPTEDEPFEDIYIILDFMETDLHKIIYSKNDLTDEHIQYFIYQILKGLKYIHSAHVIHRDLKPSNLLLNSNCDLKICDFGLARGTREEADYELTEYVVTRWYRAPEVMCSCQEYDHKIDVWSVGCILAELHGRKPLFPGDDYIKQMNLIFKVLGTPSKEDMKFITNEKALEYIKSLKKQPKFAFDKIYKDANPLALDLLEKMLVFNPHKRISVDEALAHPYLKSLHNPNTETECKEAFDFEFEKTEMTKEVIQEFMWKEIQHFRPELRNKTWRRDGKVTQPGHMQH
jgi:serine/threonine protein kinase